MSERRRVLLGLVVRGPVGVEIDGLRRALASPDIERIAPHITLSPPRNVSVAQFESFEDAVRAAARETGHLVLSLGPVQHFGLSRGVVFLKVSDETDDLQRLRGHIVNATGESGDLAHDFVAHVTIGTRLSPETVRASCDALSYRSTAEFKEIVLFEAGASNSRSTWVETSSFPLGDLFVHGRGGRELSFSLSSSGDEQTRTFEHREGNALSTRTLVETGQERDRFVVTVRNAARVVAVARGRIDGHSLELERLSISSKERGVGIGSALLSYLERHGRENRCVNLRLVVRDGCPAEAFYLARGYRRGAVLVAFDKGIDYVILEALL